MMENTGRNSRLWELRPKHLVKVLQPTLVAMTVCELGTFFVGWRRAGFKTNSSVLGVYGPGTCGS